VAKAEGANHVRGGSAAFDEPESTGEIPLQKVPTSPAVMLAFTLAGLVFAMFYVVWFLVAYDAPNLPMVFVSVGTALLFATGVPLSRTRYTTAASIAIATLASLVLLVYTAALSTDSDVHLLYLAAGFAALALFPEYLWKTRITYTSAMIGLVIASEFIFPPSSVMGSTVESVNDIAAGANRMWTVLVVAMAMAIVLHRTTRRHRHLSGAAELGEYRANTDPMTGLANRRPVLARLHELDDSGVSGYGVALVDIDSFKSINDRLGHEEGDALISAVARRMRAHFRLSDLVSRWGGDEFLILLPHVAEDELFSILDRLRESIAVSPFSLGSDPIEVTLSIGAAIARPGQSGHTMINAADRALYTAKHSGRNRVVLAQSSVSDSA